VEDARRMKRDRRELDQQARELLKLPTRKERAEVLPDATSLTPLSRTLYLYVAWLQRRICRTRRSRLSRSPCDMSAAARPRRRGATS